MDTRYWHDITPPDAHHRGTPESGIGKHNTIPEPV